MTAGLCRPPTPGIGCTDPAEVGDRVLRTAEEEPGAPALVLQGPGSTGKSFLLASLAEAHRRAGRAVASVRTAPDPATVSGELAVLVDDAHRLTEAAAHRLRNLTAHPSVRLVIACRPWPRPPALLELIEGLGGHRRLIVLGHLDRGSVARLAEERLGAAATPALVDVVHHQTGGLPALVHAVLRWLEERKARFGPGPALGWLAPRQPARMAVPDEVLDRVRADVALLDDDARALLHAVALGAPLDPRLLGDLLGIPSLLAADLIEETRAGGLLLGRGEVVPLASWVLVSATPDDVSRHRRRRLLELLVERGDDPLQLARALAADGVRDAHVARVLERHGDAALRTDPALAATLLGEAVASGASVSGLAARRAHAEALAGDLDTALQWADTVLTDGCARDRSSAAGVAAAVLAQRGLLARSGALYRLAGPERAGSAALALLATGFPAEATAVLEEAGSGPFRGLPTMLSGSEELVAQGILQSVRSGPDAQADTSAALSTLTRAAALLEPVGRTALLLDTPAALAALVALHSGELGMAESVLTRALAADVGGAPSRPRHLLLLAWVAMLRGHPASARASMSEAVSAARQRLEPRDELFLRALEVGLARRNSDTTGLSGAWRRAREAVLRYPVDLFTLLPLGELVIAGARLKDSEHLGPHVAAAQALLARLGDPPLWSTSLHWSAAQAAIVADDPTGLRPHAAALVAASRTSPYAATLARAGRCWLRVLTGDVDAAAVTAVAGQLASVGLSWDGSRLAGQAAARALEARDRTVLLTCARALTEACGADGGAAACPAPDQVAPPGASGQLSDREREVARLVVEGQTYREIGGRLFISAKTVEHHVSRMRQRLGASNRSDLLARLRAELSTGA